MWMYDRAKKRPTTIKPEDLISIRQIRPLLIENGFTFIPDETFGGRYDLEKNGIKITICEPCRYIKIKDQRIPGIQFHKSYITKLISDANSL